MKSRTTRRFRDAFRELPEHVQRAGRRAYAQFARDPHHPGLDFKRIHAARPIYSARVSLGYRALGVMDGDEVVWFWVGKHADYDRRLRALRRG